MNYRSFRFMKPNCRVLRSNYLIDVTNLRDTILTDYSTVRDKLSCYKEPLGGDIINSEFVGRIAVDTFRVYFPGKAPVEANDILLIDGSYYDVHGVSDFGENGWEMYADVTLKNLQRS